MKAITDDPLGFFESGGWTFLDPESGSDGEGDDGGEEEEDEAYEPTDIESDEEFVLKPFFFWGMNIPHRLILVLHAINYSISIFVFPEVMMNPSIPKRQKMRPKIVRISVLMRNPEKIGRIWKEKRLKMMPITQLEVKKHQHMRTRKSRAMIAATRTKAVKIIGKIQRTEISTKKMKSNSKILKNETKLVTLTV